MILGQPQVAQVCLPEAMAPEQAVGTALPLCRQNEPISFITDQPAGTEPSDSRARHPCPGSHEPRDLLSQDALERVPFGLSDKAEQQVVLHDFHGEHRPDERLTEQALRW